MILAGAHAGAERAGPLPRPRREAVASLQHPNIVADLRGRRARRPALTSRWSTWTAAAWPRRLAGTPQPPARRRQLVETLARAMHHAHQQRHRPPRPEAGQHPPGRAVSASRQPRTASRANATGLADSSVPKITDFGLAKQLEPATGRPSTGAILGTPELHGPRAGGRQDQARSAPPPTSTPWAPSSTRC